MANLVSMVCYWCTVHNHWPFIVQPIVGGDSPSSSPLTCCPKGIAAPPGKSAGGATHPRAHCQGATACTVTVLELNTQIDFGVCTFLEQGVDCLGGSIARNTLLQFDRQHLKLELLIVL
jgi:hypothetical protein